MTCLFIIGALFYRIIYNQVPNIHKLHGKPPFANETDFHSFFLLNAASDRCCNFIPPN